MPRPSELETWEVTGPWGAISVVVCSTDDMGYTRTEDEKRRRATTLAIQDTRIGDGVLGVHRIA